MRAAVLVQPGRFEVQEVELPGFSEQDVRVKIEYCGICSSNIAPWKGAPWFSYPFPPGAPGHEAVGLVDAIGSSANGVKIGERVAVLSYGGFAEYNTVNASSVVPMGDLGFPFLGEPLGCAANVYLRSAIQKGDWVTIVGIGFLGCVLVQLAVSAGARVIAVSRRPTVLKLAKEYGAEFALPFEDRSAIANTIRSLTGAKLCDVVIEAAGVQETLDLASDLVKTRGRLVIAGYHQGGPRSVNMQDWNWKGIDVINAHEREEAIYVEGIRLAVDAVARGEVRLSGLISGVFPLNEIERGFFMSERKPEGFVKAIVEMV
jgi:2-desacetyl-2-hydroxyethyl bacteriochlorophyllide A dehydrogenase